MYGDFRLGHTYPREDLFQNGPESELLLKLKSIGSLTSYKRNNNIFIQESPCHGFYFLSNGKVKISVIDENGKELILKIYERGEFISLETLFRGKRHGYTATCLADSEVYYFDRNETLEKLKEHPEMTNFLFELLSEEFKNMVNLYTLKNQKNVSQRLAILLYRFFQKQGKLGELDGTEISLGLSRSELASLVGTSSESVTRCIGELKSESVIDEKDHIIKLLNENKLDSFTK